jgi:hypothetical protein
MFKTFDYKCVNQECSEYDKRHERLHLDNETQTCKVCQQALLKMPCAPKHPHISWSTWRI